MVNIPQLYSNSPEGVAEGFVASWNRMDAVSLAGLFAEDAEFVNVVGLWWHNRQAIYKAHEYGLRVIFPDSEVSLRQVKVKQLSSDIAVVHARMRLRGQNAHAGVKKPGDRFNVFSFVVQKLAKGWVCVSAHNTDVVAGKETNVLDEEGELRSVDYRT
jgi:uncharacterized protein (TIGR02246 family)